MVGGVPATPIHGRDDDLRVASSLLAPGRLLTLVGPAGSGKTRLALAMAETEPDVVIVDLAPLTGAAQVLPTVARAARLGDGGARPVLDVVGGHLRGRCPLLVLDNVEHLLDDGHDAQHGEGAAEQIAALVAEAGGTRVVATSRTPLHIPGERLVSVDPLPVPDLVSRGGVDELGGVASVALFVDRVRDGDPSFVLTARTAPVVAEICVALDGLPLALVLAAVHVRTLGLDEVLARCRGRFTLPPARRAVTPRHRSLRDALNWSLDRLDAGVRDALAELSVFAGGWDIPAAEAVRVAGGPDTVSAVTELVDRSLVVARPDGTAMRYSMLATVRETAAEMLETSGRREATVAAYRMWACGLALDVSAAFGSDGEASGLDRAETDHANLRAALDLGSPGDAVAVRTATALVWFWDVRGHLTEGRGHLERLLTRSTGDPGLDAAAGDALGRLLLAQGNHLDADRALRASITAFDALGDDRGVAWASATLALGSVQAGGNTASALGVAEEAVRRAGDEPGIVRGRAYCALAVALAAVGRVADAAAVFDRTTAELAPGAGAWARGRTLHLRGWIAYRAGELEAAAGLQRQALDLLDGLGDRRVVADCLDVLGLVSARREPGAAAASFDAADTLRSMVGVARQAYLEHDVRAAVDGRGADSPLTAREEQVARLIADGLTNAAIGRAFGISERTAERHAENIRGKLGVGSRAQVAAWVAGRGGTQAHPSAVSGSTHSDDVRPRLQ